MNYNKTKSPSSNEIMAVLMSLILLTTTIYLVFILAYTASPLDNKFIDNYDNMKIMVYLSMFVFILLIILILSDTVFEFRYIAALRNLMIKLYSFYIGLVLISGAFFTILLFYNDFSMIDFDLETHLNFIFIVIIISATIMYVIQFYYIVKHYVKRFTFKVLRTIPPHNEISIYTHNVDKNGRLKKYNPTKIRHLRNQDLHRSYGYSVFYLSLLLLTVASVDRIDNILTESNYISLIPAQDGLKIILSIAGFPSEYTNQFISHFELSSLDIVALGILFIILVGPGILFCFNFFYIIEKKLTNLTYIFSTENEFSYEKPASQLGFLFVSFIIVLIFSLSFQIVSIVNPYVGLFCYVIFIFAFVKSERFFELLLVFWYSFYMLWNIYKPSL